MVKLQFGLQHDIPGPPKDMRQFHKLDKRFKTWYESNDYHFLQEYEPLLKYVEIVTFFIYGFGKLVSKSFVVNLQ